MQVSTPSSVLSPSLFADFEAALGGLLMPWQPPLPAPRLAVALSGGGDSMALVLLAQQWARAHGGEVVAFTVDHGLRADSAAEAAWVAEQMQARGITHQILTLVPEKHQNLQAWARAARYDALAQACRAQGILHCLLAHHAGDNRETSMLQQARGETADGPSGMSGVRVYQRARFLRPLLAMEHATLLDFLRGASQAWVEDPSNRNAQFARVRTRQHLQEDMSAREAADAALQAGRADRRAREDALAAAAMDCLVLHPLGMAWIDLERWRKLNPALAHQLLADCLRTISGQIYRARGHETQRLADALRGHDGAFRRRTLQHCDVSVREGQICIARETARVEGDVALEGAGEVFWDRRFRVHFAMPPHAHYHLGALRQAGLRQLREMGYRGLRLSASSPALWHLDEVVFVPHIEASPLSLPDAVRLEIGFAPAKPLAAHAFW